MIENMTKPFDKDVLVAELKAQGLPVLEDTAEKIIVASFAWLKKSGELHSNPWIKGSLPPAVDLALPIALGQVDKIDGVIGS